MRDGNDLRSQFHLIILSADRDNNSLKRPVKRLRTSAWQNIRELNVKIS